jgi:hypothetical protein
MTNKAIAYYTSTYTQGMATYPCFVIITELASVISSNWMMPASLRQLRAAFGDLPQLTAGQVSAINSLPGAAEGPRTWAEIEDHQTEHHRAVLAICGHVS